MCAINGIFSYKTPGDGVDAVELTVTRDQMAHRGPDGFGEWIHARRHVGLGHRRLAIIDLSEAGAQPMVLGDGRLRVVFNGEIYNYRELRQLAESRGARFVSNSDTEILLHLYAQQGPDMVGLLRGMFAFAIWDEGQQGLFLARDPFGIKPLYYADQGGVFRFASQVKALVAGGGLSLKPDPAGHVGYFLLGSVPDPFTLHAPIRALPAGCRMWVDRGGVREPQVYASLQELFEQPKASHPRSVGEMQDRLALALRDTVRSHMVADVEVGIFLSAGLDSSTVAAIATECAPGQLRSLTLGFKELAGTEDDETAVAAEIAAYFQTRHRYREVGRDEFKASVGTLLERMDQPTMDGVNTYFVSKAASELGLKVAMSGLGGDELFGGYPSFQEVPALARWLKPFSWWGGLGRGLRRVLRPWVSGRTSPKYAGLFEYGGTLEGAYLLRRALFMPWEIEGILGEAMTREGMGALGILDRIRLTYEGIRNRHLQVSAMETSWFMRNQLLRDSDWAGMAHSVEIRVPLVDIEFARAVVPLIKSQFVPTKIEMARSPAKHLPESLLRRRKTGFNIPVRDWLVADSVGAGDRGLRGWARVVYEAQTGQGVREVRPAVSVR